MWIDTAGSQLPCLRAAAPDLSCPRFPIDSCSTCPVQPLAGPDLLASRPPPRSSIVITFSHTDQSAGQRISSRCGECIYLASAVESEWRSRSGPAVVGRDCGA
ncbi:hypothetical protein BASA60_002604 [Batrachochytrium salamandrivorans]|nr:hypothetical protein BASA60_002604 [Batrachochytrium salamandrivorans]